jgi:hypothetical protein
MVSSYLERPIRTLEQALEDRARVREKSLELGPRTAADLAVDRYEWIGVLKCLFANDHDTAADDLFPPGGRRVA